MDAQRASPLDLGPDDLHVWSCRDGQAADDALLDRCYRQLDDGERARHGRFYFDKHRRQYLLARAMLRSTLSLYATDVSPEQWRFSPNEYGKPRISAPATPLQFNLSHTDGMIVLAITKDAEVGIDVERRSPRRTTPGPAELADRFFSPREARDLRALPVRQQTGRFYDLWTLKEAYIKACGKGLLIPLRQFSFLFPSSDGVDIEFGSGITDDPRGWKFWLLRASETHTVAVAIKGNASDDPFPILLREMTPTRGCRAARWPYLRSSARGRSPPPGERAIPGGAAS